MNCAECSAQLNEYLDGELDPAARATFDAHLVDCVSCQNRLDALRRLLRTTTALPREIAPSSDLWPAIQLEIREHEHSANPSSAPEPLTWTASGASPSAARPTFTASQVLLGWFVPLALAASVVFLATFAERQLRQDGPGWLVANIAGAPRVDAKRVERQATFRVGQWLETDHASRAKVSVGSIGEVSVDPNSRLRLTGVAEKDHRLQLERGSLSALIWAPPRLFFVDTPSATAVDLGCAYTLTVDDNGDGELEVTLGYVALQHGNRESIIRMGMKCITRRGAGPGTPYMLDAPDALRHALIRFDFARGGATALQEVLEHARAADAITLWHLLGRTETAARAQVFDTLVKLSPPPVGVTRAGILAGDVAMRHAWATALGLGTFATR